MAKSKALPHTDDEARRKLHTRLDEWAKVALAPQGLAPARHHKLMIQELEGLAKGRWDRLMILLPPGSAKSTYTSVVMPPWFLAREPSAQIIAASHTAGLARSFGRGVRGLITEHGALLGLRLDPSSRAAGRFGLVQGGSYFATGVRGPVTGQRADLVIIDDPVKSQREADSAAHRDLLWEWFRSELVTRLKPRGRMVLVMTRWHPDDLGGRLLASDDKWKVLRLPALAEPGDPMKRIPGQALWPKWESAAALERKRLLIGDRAFASLFQQSPRAPGGRLFQVKRIVVEDERLAGASVRAWDLAASFDSGDWTVGVRLCRAAGPDGVFQVVDVVRLQGGPEQVEAAIRRVAAKDGREVRIGLPQDPGQAGRFQVSYLVRGLAGFRVAHGVESGAKTVRASPVASQANAGNLSVLRGDWNRDFLEELRDFPGGAKDDQVDALSRAFAMLLEHAEPVRQVANRWTMR